MPDGEYTFVHLVKYGAPRGNASGSPAPTTNFIRVLRDAVFTHLRLHLEIMAETHGLLRDR
jgi:hypothetical protein